MDKDTHSEDETQMAGSRASRHRSGESAWRAERGYMKAKQQGVRKTAPVYQMNGPPRNPR
ncbi:MAG: hypothetical protein H6Q32_1408 [Bacteroidetes bacterium]|nr:hypothetical protein [Bacteroidota bacterium]